jgi:hypothetical protein
VEQILAFASLALFAALVVAFAAILRRAARVVADTREDESFRRDGVVLIDRAAIAISVVAEQIDRVRRRQDAPTALDEILPATLEALVLQRTEAEGLAVPVALAALGERLADEIGRAARALEMVEHGCALVGSMAGRPSELEGETSIKRGYLNLLHAREALLTLGVDLRSGRVDASRWFSERPRPD